MGRGGNCWERKVVWRTPWLLLAVASNLCPEQHSAARTAKATSLRACPPVCPLLGSVRVRAYLRRHDYTSCC